MVPEEKISISLSIFISSTSYFMTLNFSHFALPQQLNVFYFLKEGVKYQTILL